MRFPDLIVFYYFAILIGCNSKTVLNESRKEFTIPIVLNTSISDSLKKNINDSLLFSFIPIMGKFKYSDTIDFASFIGKSMEEDDPLMNDFVHDSHDWIENDSLDVNGFEMFVDYNQTVYYGATESQLLKYYPVFIVNSTTTTKIFTGHDGMATGVQQATFGGENWRSLNRKIKRFIGCGNGYFYIKVHPGEFVLLLVRKYSGDYRPQVRVAIKNGQSIYVSKSFIGNINESQYKYLDSLSTGEFEEDREIFQF